MLAWASLLVRAALADPASVWRDILPPPTVTVQSSAPRALDLAPATGPDVAVVAIIAAIVIGVTLYVVRTRRRRR